MLREPSFTTTTPPICHGLTRKENKSDFVLEALLREFVLQKFARIIHSDSDSSKVPTKCF
jgi:hypothetical protein